MESGIYCLVFSNGQRYIGQTNCFKRRMGEHFDDMNGVHKNKKIRHAVYACGLPTWEVLERCSLEELNDAEIKWIKYYDTYCNGLNMTIGGGYARKGVSRNPSVSTPVNVSPAPSPWPVYVLIGFVVGMGVYLILGGQFLILFFAIFLALCLR